MELLSWSVASYWVARSFGNEFRDHWDRIGIGELDKNKEKCELWMSLKVEKPSSKCVLKW